MSRRKADLSVRIADMISTNTPLFSRSMAVPKDMSQLSVEAFTAGIVEAVLDGLGFVSAAGSNCLLYVTLTDLDARSLHSPLE